MGAPEAGALVTVMCRRGAESSAFPCHVVSRTAGAVLLTVTDALPCGPGEHVVLVTGPRTARKTAAGRFAGTRGAQSVILTPHGWLPFDQRSSPRYPLAQPVEVRFAGGERCRGVALDISAGGMAVEVETSLRPDAVDVLLDLAGYAATLGCEVVATRALETSVVLHLRYGVLSPPQLAFVRSVLRKLAAGLEEAA